MPFYLSMQAMDAAQINHILQDTPAFQPLTAKQMCGYLTGFIDLICAFPTTAWMQDDCKDAGSTAPRTGDDCKDAGGTTPWMGEVESRLEQRSRAPIVDALGEAGVVAEVEQRTERLPNSGTSLYYVMDYKTNGLEDYSPDSLTHAMREHNYGLQYWIYTVVLHRYLQTRLPDYDYETHFGGVRYLFVRGMQPSQPMSGVYQDRPDLERVEALAALFGGSK
jgi:hypothetical protein